MVNLSSFANVFLLDGIQCRELRSQIPIYLLLEIHICERGVPAALVVLQKQNGFGVNIFKGVPIPCQICDIIQHLGNL